MGRELSFFLQKESAGFFLGMDAPAGSSVACGSEVLRAVPVGTVDAAKEKHIPVVEVHGHEVKVKVGSVAHPMTPEHYIVWVCLKTRKGIQLKELPVDGAPEVTFALTADDQVLEAYEFCNLHGVWSGK